MTSVSNSSPASASASATAALRGRVLQQARRDFFAHGYSRFTMDGLAEELGMSKKTLYVHFAGKDEIIGAVIDDLAEKLRGFVEGMLERMAALHPRTVRDLQRFAPKLHAKVDAVRGTTLPYVFARFIEEGQVAGQIRSNLPPGFAIEFFLHAMQGLMQPASLERLRLAPRDVIANGIDLFFGGLLTNAGRKQYEKLFPR